MTVKLQTTGVRELYGGVAILNSDEIEDEADFGGMLFELKKLGIIDGREYQIDNGGSILMDRDAYKKAAKVLKKFGVRAVNL